MVPRALRLILVASVAACGGGRVGDGPGDGAPSAADGGSEPVDADPDEGPITVEVRASGAPVGGAFVVVHEPDGAVRDTLTTNPDGLATGEVRRGGAITLSYEALYTINDVAPGDHLLLV